MNSGPPITGQQQYAPGNVVGVGRENPAQKGVSYPKRIFFCFNSFFPLAIVNSKCKYSNLNK
jgi:hypothetical protein